MLLCNKGVVLNENLLGLDDSLAYYEGYITVCFLLIRERKMSFFKSFECYMLVCVVIKQEYLNYKICSTGNLIILIFSLLNYWSDLFKGDLKMLIQRWLPSDMIMISLHVLPPVLSIA
jgi:hypothetical protein